MEKWDALNQVLSEARAATVHRDYQRSRAELIRAQDILMDLFQISDYLSKKGKQE